MKKNILIAAIIVVVLSAVFGANRWFYGNAVTVVHPSRGSAVQAVYATGTVEATVMLPIAPRMSARLIDLNVDEGSEVKKDQILAQMEDEDIRQSLRQLQARE